MSLERAFTYIEKYDSVDPGERMLWIYMRNEVAEWFKWKPKGVCPELYAAYDAVAEFPQLLPNEAELWDELRHQLIVHLEG